jgi:pyruvate,orthophosphate dikinase
VAFTGERAEADAASGGVILVRPTASPDDIAGIQAAAGLLVARGGRTSHAAVVARQLGKVCVVNCTGLAIDLRRHRCSLGETVLREGDVISIDGDTGRVYRGVVAVTEQQPVALLERVRGWSAGRR